MKEALKVYMPQFLKENKQVCRYGRGCQSERGASIEQYKIEERSAISKRIIRSDDRQGSMALLECMSEDANLDS